MQAQKATQATTLWSPLAPFPLARVFACANASSGCRQQTWSDLTPHQSGTQNYETLYPLGLLTGVSTHGQIHSYLNGLIVGELALCNSCCEWCHVKGCTATGCHASREGVQVCNLPAGGRGEGRVWFKRASCGRGFVAAQPLRHCRLTAHHLLSRTLQLQIKEKKQIIIQMNRKKIINK